MGRRAVLLMVPAGLLATAILLSAYREGPLPGMTGGFGERTCHTCHFDNPENAKGGTLGVEGIPATYSPGQEYTLTVVLRRPTTTRAGFEMTARFTEAPRTGEQAGQFRAPDERLQIVYAPGGHVQYIQHTRSGSQIRPPGEARWTLSWTAPDRPLGPVRFNIAANASNDDASPLGDFIYTTSRTSRNPPGGLSAVSR